MWIHFNYLLRKNSNVYYQSFDNKVLGKYVIKKNRDNNWELINEQKTIEGILCYKAVMNDVVINPISLKSTTFLVTAWYAPTLPFSCGPLNYFGLPGLILEVQRRGIVYGTTTIELNPKIIPNIIRPDLSKIKDEKEIEKFMIDYFKSE
ncbi:MAG: GLPGLI family protein [Flavobacterium sp. JAD_PAG50586_2]|nr:MAG: GLPGLI family protein [Flavobacterium sp. JAD_PAG50586_2]